MTIGKSILSMTEAELSDFVQRRRTARLVTPKKKPKRITVKGLASAWGIPEGAVEAAVKEQLELFPEEVKPKNPNREETQCTPASKRLLPA